MLDRSVLIAIEDPKLINYRLRTNEFSIDIRNFTDFDDVYTIFKNMKSMDPQEKPIAISTRDSTIATTIYEASKI